MVRTPMTMAAPKTMMDTSWKVAMAESAAVDGIGGVAPMILMPVLLGVVAMA